MTNSLRSFSLNSKEFYQAVTPPPDPWLWGPGLPSEPRSRHQAVIVEKQSSHFRKTTRGMR